MAAKVFTVNRLMTLLDLHRGTTTQRDIGTYNPDIVWLVTEGYIQLNPKMGPYEPRIILTEKGLGKVEAVLTCPEQEPGSVVQYLHRNYAQIEYRVLSEIEDYFPRGSNHTAARKIRKRMEQVLAKLPKEDKHG